MNIQLEKLNLIEWIAKINDASVIKKLMGIREKNLKKEKHPDEITKREIDSLNRGLKDIQEGKLHSHKSVKKIYEKYL